MFIFIEIADLTPVTTFLLGIPESVGLLTFGIGLVATAASIRWFLGRGETEKTDEKCGEKGLTNN